MAHNTPVPLHDGPGGAANGSIPLVGLGVYQMNPGECYDAVLTALKLGYRHVDTAIFYANEAEVGRAIRDSGVPREEVFVTTKVETFRAPKNKDGFRDALDAVEGSLRRSGLAYLDMVLLHSPHFPEHRAARWRGLEQAVADGKVRHIGVSNYGAHHLDELMKTARVRPAVNQLEIHAFCRRPALLEATRKHGIVLEAYSPLAKATRLADPTVARIAAAHHRTPAQVLLRYVIQLGAVVLPKSVREHRMLENIALFDFELSDADMKTLDALDEGAVTGWDPTTMP